MKGLVDVKHSGFGEVVKAMPASRRPVIRQKTRRLKGGGVGVAGGLHERGRGWMTNPNRKPRRKP
jgi:hypothetical protein